MSCIIRTLWYVIIFTSFVDRDSETQRQKGENWFVLCWFHYAVVQSQKT